MSKAIECLSVDLKLLEGDKNSRLEEVKNIEARLRVLRNELIEIEKNASEIKDAIDCLQERSEPDHEESKESESGGKKSGKKEKVLK